MTLRQSLGADVQRVYEQVEALLDSEDGIVALFDGRRVVTYATGFGVSASQLELLGMALERALREGLGRPPAKPASRRRNREHNQGSRTDAHVNGNGYGTVRRVLQLASKIA